MSRQAAPIELTPEEDATLTMWGRSRTLPVRQLQRAQIVQLAAAGMDSQDIAATLGVSRPTVQLWRQRFLALRLRGFEQDAPRPGRLARITEQQVAAVLEATLHTTPPNVTHWSTRTMAQAQGLSEATVRRIWQRNQLKPHLVATFKLSRDKAFVAVSTRELGSGTAGAYETKISWIANALATVYKWKRLDKSIFWRGPIADGCGERATGLCDGRSNTTRGFRLRHAVASGPQSRPRRSRRIRPPRLSGRSSDEHEGHRL